MKKKIAIIILGVSTLSAVTWFTKPWSYLKNATVLSDSNNELPNVNLHLEPEFKKITAFYSQPQLAFTIEYTHFIGTDLKTAEDHQYFNINYSPTHYLSINKNQTMLCNQTLSLLVDNVDQSIFLDSAWDLSALIPTKFLNQNLLNGWDTITRNQKGANIEYTIPAISGTGYSTLLVESLTGKIVEINIFQTDYSDLDNPIQICNQFKYANYATNSIPNASQLNHLSYVKGSALKMQGFGQYANYKIHSSQNYKQNYDQANQ